MAKKDNDTLQNELLRMLQGGGAHADFDTAIAKLPKKCRGATVKGIPYTIWRILQHMRLSQRDLLDYIKNPDYVEPSWPEDYWPQEKSPPSSAAWDKSVEQFRCDLQEVMELVKNPKTKILETIPHIRNGPPILREILLVADHNSYHIGQIILLRGLLGVWKD